MKGKPSQPLQSFNHSARVVALVQVRQHLLASADSKGKIRWGGGVRTPPTHLYLC